MGLPDLRYPIQTLWELGLGPSHRWEYQVLKVG